jgi:glucose/arabinose dehydrogenase
MKPGTSTPFIADVGWYAWEELNVGTKGANFGWPGFEGGNLAGNPVNNVSQQQDYYYGSVSGVKNFVDSNPTVTAPIYSYGHVGDVGNAIMVGDFYRGELIIADLNRGTIEALKVNDQNRVTTVRRFETEAIPAITYMDASLDGGLYYVNLYAGKIERWKPIV